MRKSWCIGVFILLFFMYNQYGALSQGESSAAAACVMEVETGRVLFEKNMNDRLPMASTTKVMTALLAIENGALDENVTCSQNAFGVSGTSIYLAQGETLALGDMLLGLMLSSGNDAAVAIAEHIGGSVEAFAGQMNARAAQIGAMNTNFINPHGLPAEGHYTTAYDLALIARTAMENETFRRIVSTQQASIPWEGRTYHRVLKNKNSLLSSYEGATGIKTGYTSKAGRCLVFGAQREGMEIVGVVLSCGNWFEEAARLMDLCFEQYDMTHMLGPRESAGEIPVTGGQRQSVDMCLMQELSLPLSQGESAQVVLEVPYEVAAPVYPGMHLGTARLIFDGKVISNSEIVASERVDAAGIGYQVGRVVSRWMLMANYAN